MSLIPCLSLHHVTCQNQRFETPYAVMTNTLQNKNRIWPHCSDWRAVAPHWSVWPQDWVKKPEKYRWKNHRRSSRVSENNSFCALVLCFNWLICHSKKQKPTISKQPLLSSQYPLPASSWHLPKGHERGRPLTSAKLLKLLNCCKSGVVRVEIHPHNRFTYQNSMWTQHSRRTARKERL